MSSLVPKLTKCLLVFVFFLLILNPYTIYGNLAYLVIPFLIYGIKFKFRGLDKSILFLSALMIIISLFGVLVSFANGIGQFVHLKVAISILIYILLACSIFYFFIARVLNLTISYTVY